MLYVSRDRDLLSVIAEASSRNVAFYGVESMASEVTSSETDVADTMNLLQDEPLGTTKYVQFSPDGSYKLSDEAFLPLTKQLDMIDASDDRLVDLHKLISFLPEATARAFYDIPGPLVRYVENTSNHKRVEIVDTSIEIAGDGDIPHNSVGGARRMMVNKRDEQHQVMIEAVQNHTPQSIIVDEIGTKREAAAAGDIAQRGVQIIATAHGTKLKDLLQSAQLNFLLGGVHTVVLGDEEARRRGLRSKSVRERLDVPVFDTVVELRSYHKWVVYHNVAEAVDCILEGKTDSKVTKCGDGRYSGD